MRPLVRRKHTMESLSKQIRDQFEIAAHPQNAGPARERIRSLAAQAGFSGLALADIEIAAGEAITNAILYGSPSAASRIVISSGFTQDVFHIEVRDQGHGFDPEHLRLEEDTDALGGRGIRLMRGLMDQVDLHYNGQGMSARLSKNLSPS
jgi:anti-sigma regulatory factor (Ser/Thr protein kinase)